MQYVCTYLSPLGEILLAADESGLTGLWFKDQKYFAHGLDHEHVEKDTPILSDTRKWLNIYFSGKEPDFYIPLHLSGTDFQKEVWNILSSIPYGKTMTYGEIAEIVARKKNMKRMSAQAIGSAVGHNEISIIIPCHRVVGSNGSLTGYAGGIDKKEALLKLEGVSCENLSASKK